MVQPEGRGHDDGGVARLMRVILSGVMLLIGIGVSGVGFGIAANGDRGDLAELGGGRGEGGIMIGGWWSFGHGGEVAGEKGFFR